MSLEERSLQTHGKNSRVYVPILLDIFKRKYQRGMEYLDFTLDDIRASALSLDITVRNAGDLAYRMRSRTVLPQVIRDEGFFVLSAIGRGKYRLGKAESAIIDIPPHEPIEVADLTPNTVRRLLPERLLDFDEQALLTVMGYCKIVDHFTGLHVYRLRSHVRKSVPGIGQAELDELDAATHGSSEGEPIIVPIEAKAVADPINRVQISAMVSFCEFYYPRYEVRPLAVKVDYHSVFHVLEFNATKNAADLVVTRSAAYDILPTETQLALIRESEQRLL